MKKPEENLEVAERPSERLLEAPFHLGQWRVDAAAGELSRDERRIRLEPKLMRILLLLASEPGQVISRARVFEAVWPQQVVSDQTLDSAVSRLRSRLGDQPKAPQYIQTVPKVGYRLLATVEHASVRPTDRRDAEPSDLAIAKNADSSPPAHARSLLIALGSVLLVGAVVSLLAVRMQDEGSFVPMVTHTDVARESPSLAVVAFTATDQVTADWLASQPEHQGFELDLLDQLARLPGLRVVSSHSSQRFASDDLATVVDRQRAGQLLGADYLLQGSWERSRGASSLKLMLVETQSGDVLWSQQYDRRGRSNLEVLGAVLRQVSTSLLTSSSGLMADSIVDRPRSGPTYDLYLLGRHYWHQRQADSLLEAERLFREAAELEPEFALAHVGLASTYLSMMRYSGLPAAEALALAQGPMTRAMELAPNLAETHELLGQWHWLKAEWNPAEASLRRALILNPNLVMAHMYLGNVYNDSGRLDQAFISYQAAEVLDPLHTTVLMNLTQVSLKLGLFDRSKRYLERAKSLFPSHDFLFGLSIHLAISAGDYDETLALLAEWETEQVKLDGSPDPVDLLGCAMAAAFIEATSTARQCLEGLPNALSAKGMRTLYELMAESYTAWLERKVSGSISEPTRNRLLALAEAVDGPRIEDPTLLYELAVAWVQAGQLENGVRLFLRASERGGRDLGWMQNDPRLAPIRTIPIVAGKLDELSERQAVMVSALPIGP